MTKDRYPYRHEGPAVHGSKLTDFLVSLLHMVEDGLVPEDEAFPTRECSNRGDKNIERTNPNWLLGKMCADAWGVEYGSDDFFARSEVNRKAIRIDQRYGIIPCGPPCEKCGDNSFACGCDE